MELDELKAAWQGMDAQLQAQTAQLRGLRQAGAIQAARSRLRLMSLAQWAQLLVGALIVVWAGSYWWKHLDQPHLVAYGMGLHLYGIALLGSAAIQLTHLLRIDYRRPVLEVQRQLLDLRRVRLRCERALLVLGFVAWVPLLFIVLRAIHVDVWLTRPSAVLANLAAGLALGALMYWLTDRFRGHFERDAAGRSLIQAEAELAELAELDSAGDAQG
jgi:hypothetical protein